MSFYIPLTMSEFSCPTYPITLCIFILLNVSYSSGSTVVVHCSFNLHFFPYWLMLLNIFSCADTQFIYLLLCSSTFTLFKNWVVWKQVLDQIDICFINIFSPPMALLFTLMVFHKEHKFLILMKSNLSFCFFSG